jgi:hypothetical protein
MPPPPSPHSTPYYDIEALYTTIHVMVLYIPPPPLSKFDILVIVETKFNGNTRTMYAF